MGNYAACGVRMRAHSTRMYAVVEWVLLVALYGAGGTYERDWTYEFK